jgi:arylsulfatase A-like enzyme
MRPSPITTILGLFALAIAIASFTTALYDYRARPNIVLITIDTLRPDHLSCYGYEAIATPAIDRFADHGVLFEHAYADVTWTTPSMASVMTGLYAPHHGLQTSYQRLSPDLKTVAEYLRASGFETAAIIGSFPLDAIFGLNQGFRTYDDTFTAPLSIDPNNPPAPGSVVETVPSYFSPDREKMGEFLKQKVTHDAYRPDDQVTDAALRWLRDHRHEPFFLWVHYFGPHERPQATSDFFEERRLQLAAYDPDIVTADREVGRFLAEIDASALTNRTAIILHADHGQSLNKHDYFGHGRYVFDDAQRVPLIIRPPQGLPQGLRVGHLVRNLDIMPTVLALEHIAPDGALDGTSLVRAMQGEALPAPEETYVETYLSANRLFADVIDPDTDTRLGFRRVGFRTPQWKFVINDPVPFGDMENPPPVSNELHQLYYSEELYDLTNDPDELKNVLALHTDVADALRKRVWETQPRSKDSPGSPPIDPATRERLKSLGYVD